MKIAPQNRIRRSQSASAVLIVLILIGIMVVFVAANTRTVNSLRTEVKIVERSQIHRLAAVPNQPPAK